MTSGPTHHSVSVAATVVNDAGQLLVIRRQDNGRWEPPGGILELSESITDGVVREVREETGLVIDPIRLTGVYKNMVRGVVAIMFEAHVIGGELATSAETSRVEWWTPQQVAHGMDPAYAVRMLDAIRGNTPPAVRIHDGVNLLP